MSKQEKQGYNLQLGWKEQIGEYHREGAFINAKAEDSPEEDFANNIEVLLTEPELLKSKVPVAYNWFIKVFTKNFKLSERCSNEK